MGGICVRMRPGGLHRRSAPLDQRLMLRLPPLAAWLRKTISRRSPTSRLRRVLLARAAQLAFSAYERDDFVSPATLFYAPNIRLESGDLTTLVPPDQPEVAEGRDGLRRWLENWQEPFASIRYEMTELLDCGDRVAFTIVQEAEGKASGAPVELTVHSAMRLSRDGLIVWQRFYRERDEALRAIGIDPASAPLAGGS